MSRRNWTEERIRRELEAFLPGHDVWPSYSILRATGRRGLWQAMGRFGGPERFAEDYGLPWHRTAAALRRSRFATGCGRHCAAATSPAGRRGSG